MAGKATNWTEILGDETRVRLFREFALGNMSGRNLRSCFARTKYSREVRQLVEGNGPGSAERGRELALRALSRRNLL